MLGLPAPYRTPGRYCLTFEPILPLPGGSRLAAGSSIFHDPLPYLGRSRMLQSSYTSRRLADRIRI